MPPPTNVLTNVLSVSTRTPSLNTANLVTLKILEKDVWLVVRKPTKLPVINVLKASKTIETVVNVRNVHQTVLIVKTISVKSVLLISSSRTVNV
jgi:hypothetical protein